MSARPADDEIVVLVNCESGDRGAEDHGIPRIRHQVQRVPHGHGSVAESEGRVSVAAYGNVRRAGNAEVDGAMAGRDVGPGTGVNATPTERNHDIVVGGHCKTRNGNPEVDCVRGSAGGDLCDVGFVTDENLTVLIPDHQVSIRQSCDRVYPRVEHGAIAGDTRGRRSKSCPVPDKNLSVIASQHKVISFRNPDRGDGARRGPKCRPTALICNVRDLPHVGGGIDGCSVA